MVKYPSKQLLQEVRQQLESGPSSRPLPANASTIDRFKYRICEQFVIYKNNSHVTQRKLAELIGLDEAIMSKILHYNIEEFTIDRLLKHLTVLHPKMTVKLQVA
jgi:predicted XRE-type DNA-binding protein